MHRRHADEKLGQQILTRSASPSGALLVDGAPPPQISGPGPGSATAFTGHGQEAETALAGPFSTARGCRLPPVSGPDGNRHERRVDAAVLGSIVPRCPLQ